VLTTGHILSSAAATSADDDDDTDWWLSKNVFYIVFPHYSPAHTDGPRAWRAQ